MNTVTYDTYYLPGDTKCRLYRSTYHKFFSLAPNDSMNLNLFIDLEAGLAGSVCVYLFLFFLRRR